MDESGDEEYASEWEDVTSGATSPVNVATGVEATAKNEDSDVKPSPTERSQDLEDSDDTDAYESEWEATSPVNAVSPTGQVQEVSNETAMPAATTSTAAGNKAEEEVAAAASGSFSTVEPTEKPSSPVVFAPSPADIIPDHSSPPAVADESGYGSGNGSGGTHGSLAIAGVTAPCAEHSEFRAHTHTQAQGTRIGVTVAMAEMEDELAAEAAALQTVQHKAEVQMRLKSQLQKQQKERQRKQEQRMLMRRKNKQQQVQSAMATANPNYGCGSDGEASVDATVQEMFSSEAQPGHGNSNKKRGDSKRGADGKRIRLKTPVSRGLSNEAALLETKYQLEQARSRQRMQAQRGGRGRVSSVDSSDSDASASRSPSPTRRQVKLASVQSVVEDAVHSPGVESEEVAVEPATVHVGEEERGRAKEEDDVYAPDEDITDELPSRKKSTTAAAGGGSTGASPRTDNEYHEDAGGGEASARPMYHACDFLARAHERDLMRKYRELIKAQQEHKQAEERRAANHQENLKKEAAHRARLALIAEKNRQHKRAAERRKKVERQLMEMREKELEGIQSLHAAENRRLLEAYQRCTTLEERQQQGLLVAKEKFHRRMEREQLISDELAGAGDGPGHVDGGGPGPVQDPPERYRVVVSPRPKKVRPKSHLPVVSKLPLRTKPLTTAKRPQSYHPKSHNYNPNCSPAPLTSRSRPPNGGKHTSPTPKPRTTNVRVPAHVVSIIEKLIDVGHAVAPGTDLALQNMITKSLLSADPTVIARANRKENYAMRSRLKRIEENEEVRLARERVRERQEWEQFNEQQKRQQRQRDMDERRRDYMEYIAAKKISQYADKIMAQVDRFQRQSSRRSSAGSTAGGGEERKVSVGVSHQRCPEYYQHQHPQTHDEGVREATLAPQRPDGRNSHRGGQQQAERQNVDAEFDPEQIGMFIVTSPGNGQCVVASSPSKQQQQVKFVPVPPNKPRPTNGRAGQPGRVGEHLSPTAASSNLATQRVHRFYDTPEAGKGGDQAVMEEPRNKEPFGGVGGDGGACWDAGERTNGGMDQRVLDLQFQRAVADFVAPAQAEAQEGPTAITTASMAASPAMNTNVDSEGEAASPPRNTRPLKRQTSGSSSWHKASVNGRVSDESPDALEATRPREPRGASVPVRGSQDVLSMVDDLASKVDALGVEQRQREERARVEEAYSMAHHHQHQPHRKLSPQQQQHHQHHQHRQHHQQQAARGSSGYSTSPPHDRSPSATKPASEAGLRLPPASKLIDSTLLLGGDDEDDDDLIDRLYATHVRGSEGMNDTAVKFAAEEASAKLKHEVNAVTGQKSREQAESSSVGPSQPNSANTKPAAKNHGASKQRSIRASRESPAESVPSEVLSEVPSAVTTPATANRQAKQQTSGDDESYGDYSMNFED